ncbi:MAG: site-specific integrase [Pseudomonadota bacterium]
MTFNYYAETYLKIKKVELKPSTYYRYDGTIRNKIMPSFLDRNISEIKASELRLWLLNYQCSNKTLTHYISMLTGIFDEAIYDEVITSNPCRFLRKPRIMKKEILPFSVKEMHQIIDHVHNFNFKHYLYIAFYTGMRSGEIMGLKKEDIDFQKGFMKIKRTRGRHGENSPKTQSGFRSVPILDLLRPHLQQLFDHHDHEYLFVTQFGKPYQHNETFSNKFWLPIFDELGIKYRRLYNTRHTFATMMLSGGYTTPHNLAQILGHRDSQMVHQVYAKFINDGKFDFKLDINPY